MKKLVLLLAVAFGATLFSCGGSDAAKGVDSDSILKADSIAKADSIKKADSLANLNMGGEEEVVDSLNADSVK